MSKKTGASKPEGRNPLLLANGQTLANPEVMTKALIALDVETKKLGTPEKLIDALRAAVTPLVKKLDPKEHMTCEDCGEVSTDATDFCPFCGSEGESTGDASTTAKDDDAPATSAAIVPAADTAALDAKGKQLDEIVEKIKVLGKNVALNSFDLGVEIAKINAGDLWKARGHASFKDFVEKDLEMTRSTAYHLMDLTKKFDRGTFEKVGASKLQLIASVEDQAKREELLEDAKNGASKRTIERKAGKASSSGKAPAAATREAAPAKKSPNDITLLTKVGSKAETYPFRSVETKRPIKAYDPEKDLYCEVPVSEDVVIQIAPKKERDGTMVGITVRFVRVE